MVEANAPESLGNRHVVKKSNLPEINQNVVLDKAKFDREESLTAIKVPVALIHDFTKNVSVNTHPFLSNSRVWQTLSSL